MQLSIDKKDLNDYIKNQLNTFYPDKYKINTEVSDVLDEALSRLEYCFKHVSFKGYNSQGNTVYNHLHSDHNTLLLWLLANCIWKQKTNDNAASKLYYLNKTLHGFDCMYDTALPDIFLVFHGVGTVLGKASYSDFFVALQGCTIGSHKSKYPEMGKGVALAAHSSLIGNCHVGNNVSLSAYTNIFETDIADNTTVYRHKNGEIVMKESATSYAQSFFNVPIE